MRQLIFLALNDLFLHQAAARRIGRSGRNRCRLYLLRNRSGRICWFRMVFIRSLLLAASQPEEPEFGRRKWINMMGCAAISLEFCAFAARCATLAALRGSNRRLN